MRYRLLGRSGVRVSELALGAMTFGTETGFGVDKDESRAVYDAFREAGGNFIDTANVYAAGTSETFLGEFMAQERERIVLATKYTGGMRSRDVNAVGNSRKNMMDSIHASLKRLNTDYIDLYWVHARDYLTPIEEVMRGLDDLVSQGKVLYVGVSDTPAWVVSQANTLAELRGWTSFVGLQIRYSLVDRTVERELLPMARALDLAVTPWGVVGSGILTGKYNKDPDTEGRVQMRGGATERGLAIAQEVIAVAEEVDATPSQVAIAWVRAGEGNIIPLLGARTRDQLVENLGALEVQLGDDQLNRLNEASAISPGFPHDMLQPQVEALKRRIDNHRAATTPEW
ncbi:MAG: aldo/keto reductase [Gammaproteobacteria bacterium]|nr:MAG: aldo/keto reductase [Gammaproteobacteria bacterium]